MRGRQTSTGRLPDDLPHLWLLSDARNDDRLEGALRRLPRGSGFVFRHYHLAPAKRRARFDRLARLARGRGHMVILADAPATARRWGADGSYGRALPRRTLATAHSLRELAAANRSQAQAALLSPVFSTQSHPGGRALGPVQFLLLSRWARMPVIALGGMDKRAARRLGKIRMAAIDGLSGRAVS